MQECLLLGFGVDLGVVVGGGDVCVPEPPTDDVDLDAGLEEVHRRGVSEGVRADPAAGSGVIKLSGVAADDLVNPVAGERLSARGEHRGRGWRGVLGCQELVEDDGGLPPERAGSPFVALAVQAHGRVLAEVEVLDAEVRGFLDTGAGVVEEQDQRPVTERVPPAVGEAVEQLLDLVELEEPGFRWRDAFGGDRRDALADGEHLRGAGRDVFEQGVDHREPLVAGPGVVPAVLFEMAQERDDPLEREITDRQLGEL